MNFDPVVVAYVVASPEFRVAVDALATETRAAIATCRGVLDRMDEARDRLPSSAETPDAD